MTNIRLTQIADRKTFSGVDSDKSWILFDFARVISANVRVAVIYVLADFVR